MKQPSPGSTASTMLYGHIGHHMPHIPDGHHHMGQPLHPSHLISPPHLHHHHMSPFQRTGTLPHNFSTGTLPHNHHPRSVSCDHSGAGYGPIVQTTQNQRPGYVTLPRRPRGSWAGQAQQPQQMVARDTPSPAFSVGLAGARDPIYDGIGPRTSAGGGSSVNLNKSMDNAIPPKLSQGGRYPTTLPPLIPPIKEEAPPLRPQVSETVLGLPKSSPNILDISEVRKYIKYS